MTSYETKSTSLVGDLTNNRIKIQKKEVSNVTDDIRVTDVECDSFCSHSRAAVKEKYD
ncbi:hypothetical protein VNTUMSATTG_47600 [Vibrio nigripulchritudo]|nr:hypothetical protein VNTUMSATTG_47600 [Vibrio nigripulchritudo]